MPFDCKDEMGAKEHLDRILAMWKQNPPPNREMAIIIKDSGNKIGRCHIEMDYSCDTAMIGWLLVENEWGKGYATEATEALLEYCFCILGVHRVNALLNPENTASRRVLEKMNFRQEAHYVRKVKYTKQGVESWEDEAEYAILKQEWKK